MTEKTPKKNGRPTKYKEEYCQTIIDYFDIPPNEVITVGKEQYNNGDTKREGHKALWANSLPTFEKFAVSIGVTPFTLLEWCKVHESFSKAYTQAKALQANILNVNTLNGNYNAQWAKFFAINCLGMVDKVEVTNREAVKVDLGDMNLEDLRKLLDDTE